MNIKFIIQTKMKTGGGNMIFKNTLEDFLALEDKNYKKQRSRNKYDKIKLESLNMFM